MSTAARGSSSNIHRTKLRRVQSEVPARRKTPRVSTAFFFTQLKAMLIVVAYSFTVSFLIFKFISIIMPLRVTEEDEELGLDATQHDEKYGRNPLKA